jgi:AraC-like DNA-binding protein
MMRQPDLFKYVTLVEELSQDHQESSPEKTQKYKNLKMDESTQKESYRKLITTLEESGQFLNPDLTVRELAESMGISSARLSMVISSQSDHNFYSLVNSFRVEEAKKLLVSDEYRNRNILDVAYASGFNSKSVFNNYFKKISGITPLQYKKAHTDPIET